MAACPACGSWNYVQGLIGPRRMIDERGQESQSTNPLAFGLCDTCPPVVSEAVVATHPLIRLAASTLAPTPFARLMASLIE